MLKEVLEWLPKPIGRLAMVVTICLFVAFVLGSLGGSEADREEASRQRGDRLMICFYAKTVTDSLSIYEERFRDELLRANPDFTFAKDVWNSYEGYCE